MSASASVSARVVVRFPPRIRQLAGPSVAPWHAIVAAMPFMVAMARDLGDDCVYVNLIRVIMRYHARQERSRQILDPEPRPHVGFFGRIADKVVRGYGRVSEYG